MLEIRDVTKTYADGERRVEALAKVSVELRPGELVAVEGPSGCGKTTLLLVAGGLLEPDSGEVRLENVDLYSLDPERRADARGRSIGFVFQQFHLVPYLSVEENVLVPSLALSGNARLDPALKERSRELIDRFGLTARARHRPRELSTGERQRVALARALLRSPPIVLADEPTGNLDRENAEAVLEHLAAFAREGGAVLLVTHDPFAASFATRKIALSKGRLAA